MYEVSYWYIFCSGSIKYMLPDYVTKNDTSGNIWTHTYLFSVPGCTQCYYCNRGCMAQNQYSIINDTFNWQHFIYHYAMASCSYCGLLPFLLLLFLSIILSTNCLCNVFLVVFCVFLANCPRLSIIRKNCMIISIIRNKLCCKSKCNTRNVVFGG
jgi:hypothetical protein